MPRSSSECSNRSDSSESGKSRRSSPEIGSSSERPSPVEDRGEGDPPKLRNDEKSGSKSPSPKRSKMDEEEKKPAGPVPGNEPESIMTRTEEADFPPAKLRMVPPSIADNTSVAFQATFSKVLGNAILLNYFQIQLT